MKSGISKVLRGLLLIGLLIGLSGCLTAVTVYKAQGLTDERIDKSNLKRGDKVVSSSFADNGVGYVLQYPEGKDNSKLAMPDMSPYYEFYIRRPHPAYYALVPFTIMGDVVAFPFEIVWFFASPHGYA